MPKNKYLFAIILFILSFFVSLIFIRFLENLPKKISTNKINSEQEQQKQISAKNYPNIKILFTGDLMFDRYIRKVSDNKTNNFIFEKLTKEFLEYDFVLANLEGPITDNKSISMNTKIGSPKNYIFTFDESVAETLYKNNIKLVNLGNNHTLNFGKKGLEQTKTILEKNNINYFGFSYPEENQNERIYFYTQNDFTIAFINYNQFVTGSIEATLADIEFAKKQSDIIILYTHWGIEYQKTANKVIQNLAHKFIDSGVDLIIGSHPHVVQQKEEYKEKTIYYSLGNFIFDQYFSPETQNGLLISATINPNTKKITTDEIKISLKTNGQTIILK